MKKNLLKKMCKILLINILLHLDEKVAMLHLEKVGAKLTKMSKEQADYISVKPSGPFKPDTYRY